MGKQTAAQQLRAQGKSRPPQQPPRVPKEGLTITLKNETKLEFDGDFDAQVTPTGVLCVVEMVADLLNQNQGNPIPVIRKFVNTDVWAEVTVR